MGKHDHFVPRYHLPIRFSEIVRAARAPATRSLDIARVLGDDLTEGDNAFWLDSGTSGLAVALQSLRLPAGSGVGVPVYACVTVFAAIAAAGYRCVFLDLDPRTLRLDLRSLHQRQADLSALVLIHTFGFPEPIAEVHQIMGSRPIVEDCAHALGTTMDGRSLGRFGAGGVFSFNIGKPIAVGGGGLLVINDPAILPNVRQTLAGLALPSKLQQVMAAARRIAKATCYRPPWYGMLIASGWLSLRREGALAAQIELGPMLNMDRRLVADRLNSVDAASRRRRDWVRQLNQAAELPPPVRRYLQDDNWNAAASPILLPSHAQREASLDFFHSRGIDAYVLWPECFRTAGRFGYQAGDCPQLDEALPRLMFLPCYAELTRAQQQRILDAVAAWDHRVP